jgi:phosphoribosylaminoimidazole-succinocarboxamide synthase
LASYGDVRTFAGRGDRACCPCSLQYVLIPLQSGRDKDLRLNRFYCSSSATAAAHAESKGVILADTKFEFGLIPPPTTTSSSSSSSSDPSAPPTPSTQKPHGTLILIDEVLTPDSSRYWSAANYEAGRPQESFDKQFVRDWLVAEGKKGVEGVKLPDEIVEKTLGRYREAFERVTGKEL